MYQTHQSVCVYVCVRPYNKARWRLGSMCYRTSNIYFLGTSEGPIQDSNPQKHSSAKTITMCLCDIYPRNKQLHLLRFKGLESIPVKESC